MPKAPPPVSKTAQVNFVVSSGVEVGPERTAIYGTGGIGKSTLAAAIGNLGKNALFLDADAGSKRVACNRLGPQQGLVDWQSLRAALANDSLLAPYDVVILDSISRCEEWCVAHVIKTIPAGSIEKRFGSVDRLEDYGYGKGFQHVYEEMKKLLADLDRQVLAGRDVVVVAHSCKANVPNPKGEDFIRYEPRLQTSSTGKADVRSLFKEWLDHLVFVDYDISVGDDQKAIGHGTRTIYCQERPTHVAKSRSLRKPIVYDEGSFDLWTQLFAGR